MSRQPNGDVQLSVQCRDGPLAERRCTDLFCCITYLLLLATVLFLGVFASSAIKMTWQEVNAQLEDNKQAEPLLAITSSITYIVLSLACVTAVSFLLVVISFIIPAVSAYLVIPLILLLMLLFGGAFLYSYFGKQLPFVDSDFQQAYATAHSLVSLIIGLAFLLGFLVSLIVILLKQERIRFIVAALRLAKSCFWDNCYMILLSFLLSALSLAALYANLRLLEISELQKDGQQLIDKRIFSVIILVEMLWTHGFLQAYADFLFQAIALHWYFNEKQRAGQYSRVGLNLCGSVGMSVRHVGTIVFGWVLAFIPESFNVLMHQLEERTDCCYRYFCYCHKWLCEDLSKYCYIGTVMYSQPFCRASSSVRQLRQTAKHTFPELYMIGNFYITLMKIFVLLVGMVVCYFLVMQHPKSYTADLNLLAPLLVTLLGSLEIGTHFLDSTGLTGDTIYLAYVIDYNCESANFGNLNAEHCPEDAYEIIREARIGKYAQYE